MKRLVCSALLYGACLATLPGVYAQVYRDDPYYRSDPNNRSDPYYRNNGDYDRYGNRGYSNNRYGRSTGNYGSVVDQVLFDLNRVSANSNTDNHERDHFYKAQQALAEFQDRWSQGRFDDGKLDKAVNSLKHLVDSRQISGRNRSLLANDLSALRQFRASRGQFGAYGRDSGYLDPRVYR